MHGHPEMQMSRNQTPVDSCCCLLSPLVVHEVKYESMTCYRSISLQRYGCIHATGKVTGVYGVYVYTYIRSYLCRTPNNIDRQCHCGCDCTLSNRTCSLCVGACTYDGDWCMTCVNVAVCICGSEQTFEKTFKSQTPLCYFSVSLSSPPPSTLAVFF